MPDAGSTSYLEYLDFDLEIGMGNGRAYPVAVLHSPAGEPRGIMQFPFDEIRLRLHLVELENVLLRSATSRRVTPSREEQEVEQFGSMLFDALFTDDVRNCYSVSLERARSQGKGLRIRLRIQASELAALPWEFMFDSHRSGYLCFSRQTPIVRYPALPLALQPLEITPPFRILGMVASPHGLAELDVRSEKERLTQPLEKLQQAGLIELHWLEGQTWRHLQRAMRRGPWHIFHFIGHGGFDAQREEGFLALSNERGDRADLRATQLAQLLSDHPSLRLAVLNACEGGRSSQQDVFSSTASILLRSGVPAALAMQNAITDRAAVEFARTFYESLADGMAVDTAVSEGRLAISLAFVDTIEWGTPVLYLRAVNGVLFDVHRQNEPKQELERPQIEDETRPDPLPVDQDISLRRIYEDGLSAYYLRDWERARRFFEVVNHQEPGYLDTVERLRFVDEQLDLNRLYMQAQNLMQDENWQSALGALEELEQRSQGYKDVSTRLSLVRKQTRLAALYADAQSLSGAGKFRAVVEIFDEIKSLDPQFSDPHGLLQTAQKGLKNEERQEQLRTVYSRALQEIGQERWKDAKNSLEQVQRLQLDYRDTVALLTQVDHRLMVGKIQKTPLRRMSARLRRIDRVWWVAGTIIVIVMFVLLAFGSDISQVVAAWFTSPLAAGATQVADKDGMVMVFVPSGEFEMGCDSEHNVGYDCSGDELPLHTVSLNPFWIDKTEVTNAMYELCRKDGTCQPPTDLKSSSRSNYYGNPEFANFPVIFVSWEDANTYCVWAGRRLPSEAEWEKAARGASDTRAYSWSDDLPNCTIANFNNGFNCVGDTSEAGSYLDGASPYGVLDMAGNVWEWVSDWYSDSYYAAFPKEDWPNNPQGPGTGNFRVLRGGSWSTEFHTLGVASRFNAIPSGRGPSFGFRCAASP